MELDDEDLCRWLLLANDKYKKLDHATVRNLEAILCQIEEGREVSALKRKTMLTLSKKFDKNLVFDKTT